MNACQSCELRHYESVLWVLRVFPQKIKEVYLKDPHRYVTLQHILESERRDLGAEWPKVGATLALMWLKR